ncbi:hypothetical protein BVC80_717g14 [Macleaya cordata]|uniref:RNase H type-1 domain-containing protein n=1 Tax=Macleaya cordata TaxID=56857 RepID=A0A200PM53_MACCD|nr:hypothetical protein BVC80_717g14 [Macleaya cordata]
MKLNVDGGTAPNSIAAGIVMHDSEGTFIAGSCFYDGNWHGVDAALEAEARDFLKGLEMAHDFNCSSIIIEGDSKNMVNYLLDDRLKYPWRIRSLILDWHSISPPPPPALAALDFGKRVIF